MKKTAKTIITIVAIILVIVIIGALCYGYYESFIKKVQNPVATMEVEGYGTIKIELYKDKAPNTVANFITLANRGYYNGLTFHRIVKDFMIQGGDKSGDGSGSPSLSDLKDGVTEDKEYSIKGEFSANGYSKNDLRLEEGVIAMARGDYSSLGSTILEEGYNSAGSQFFIVTKNQSKLNGLYAGFGKVIEGLDIVHKIEETEIKPAESESSEASTPVNAPVITSITVETYGKDYGTPTTNDKFDVQSWFSQNYGSSVQ